MASTRGGFFAGAFFLLLVVVAILVLAWVLVLPRAITASVSRLSGCETAIAQFHANPFSGGFTATDVNIANPNGWSEDALLEISTIKGRFDLGSLSQSTLLIEEVQIDIARLVIVVDAEGKTNFEAMGPSTASLHSPAPVELEYVTAGLPALGDGPSAVNIRRLELRIHRVDLVDIGVQPARTLTDDINYEHTYENVRSFQQVLTPELMSALFKSPALWEAVITNALSGGDEASGGGLMQLWNRLQGSVNSFFQGLEQTEKP